MIFLCIVKYRLTYVAIHTVYQLPIRWLLLLRSTISTMLTQYFRRRPKQTPYEDLYRPTRRIQAGSSSTASAMTRPGTGLCPFHGAIPSKFILLWSPQRSLRRHFLRSSRGGRQALSLSRLIPDPSAKIRARDPLFISWTGFMRSGRVRLLRRTGNMLMWARHNVNRLIILVLTRSSSSTFPLLRGCRIFGKW